jgi:DICT domain-containing protein
MAEESSFGIGILAERAGVTPGVLRTWENRFGFPAGTRTPSGHRRFADHDVRLVREVLEVRESGVPLQVAIASVTRRHAQAAESVHAALGRRFPHLRPERLSRRTLLAVSHAVEDESLARADRPLVLGAFQEGHRYGGSRHRWDELGRTASWAAVVADFDDALPADPAARPARCQIAADSPLRREWTVVTLSHAHAAALSAWEVPSAAGVESHYEAVITTHRAAVIAAAEVLVGAAVAAGAEPPPRVADLLDPVVSGPDTAAADADRMWLRALAGVDS